MENPTNSISLVEFRNEEQAIRLNRTRIGCYLTLALMPLGSALDYAGYPDKFTIIFINRMICEAVILGVLLASFTQYGKKNAKVLSTIWGLAPAISIAWMIYVTEGSFSPYYAGLNLVILGTCVLLPFRFAEAALYCSAVLLFYVIACILHTENPFVLAAFITNLLFIFMTSALCITSCHFDSISRFKDFSLRTTLRENNEQLQELDRAKTEFFANVSHELRTPLTTILVPVEELISRQDEFSFPKKVSESLGVVKQSAKRLLQLIDNILDLVKFEAGKSSIYKEVIQLDQLVLSHVESMSVLANQKDIEISITDSDSGIKVEGDISAIEKVITNLISNAIKFTPNNGEIYVSVRKVQDFAILKVCDSGIGIPEEQQKNVFDRFHQVDSSATRKYQGLGIGLALTKELVEIHSGKILLTSNPGEGSVFTVELPLYSEVSDPIQAHPSKTFAEKRKEDIAPKIPSRSRNSLVYKSNATFRKEINDQTNKHATTELASVLVIDDEPAIRKLLASILSTEYSVHEADDGISGFELAKKTQPSVVLVDMMMPGMSGLELSEKIRACNELDDCKIVMLTARIDEQLKIDALRNSIDDFLTKPFSASEVRARIKNLSNTNSLQLKLKKKNLEIQAALTKLQATEGQLIQSEKMNALGSLSAGLLHEINNPLNHTLMAIDYAKGMLSEQHDLNVKDLPKSNSLEISESLEDIEAGMVRIGEVVSDLRAFAYPEESGHFEQFTLNSAIETSLRFTAHLTEGIEIEIMVEKQDKVYGLKTHISQLFINLLQNASDALKAVEQSRTRTIKISCVSRESRKFIEFYDNGTGIEPQNIEHLFEPFFTTKEVGSGIGLGLSVCHTIVSSHGGTLSVQSEVGQWTKFSFDLAENEVTKHVQ